MSSTFKYHRSLIPPANKLNQSQKYFLRPIIFLKFKINKEVVEYPCLIDSGADYCLFHSYIGQKIGLNIKQGKKLIFYGTSGAKQTCYFHEIEYQIDNFKVKTWVGFSDDIENLDFGLLGQTGFFNKFSVKFDYSKQEIELAGVT